MLTIPREGLVAEYYLNGDATDTSGNGYNGTATDVTRVDTDIGYQSKCGSFNGSSSKIIVDNFDVSDVVCVSIWFQVIGNSSQRLLTIGRSPSNYHNVLTIDGHNTGTGGILIRDFDTDFNFSYNGPSINDGLFHHLLLQTNKGNYNVYLDGKQVYSYSGRSINYASQPLYIGYDGRDNVYYLNGKLSLLRIYDGVVLTEPEIQALYLEGLKKLSQDNNTIPELLKGCVAYYDFRGGDLHNLVTGEKATNNGATLTADHLGYENCAYGYQNDDNYIRLEYNVFNNLLNSDYTYNIILKIDSIPSDKERRILSNYVHSDNNINIKTDGHLIWYLYDGSHYNISFDYSQYVGEWHMITCIMDRDNGMKLFFDGSYIGSNSYTGNGDNCSGEVNILNIWEGHIYYPRPLDGDISLVMIYNRALSDSEIKTLYNLLMK